MNRVILASASPRRKELLTNMGIDFEIIVSDVEEKVTKVKPNEIVIELSKLKAEDVAGKAGVEPGTLIIAADTLVFLGDERLGKPKDTEDAVEMLKELSGRSHEVITGVTLIYNKGNSTEECSFYNTTEVTFEKLDEDEIREYVSTGEPMDKAGSYAIQGKSAKFVKCINGDYSNVVGLPVPSLYKTLKSKGLI